MKVRIYARPGELEARADDLVEVLGQLLLKAQPSAQIDQKAKKLDYEVLQTTVDRSARQVKRVQRRMLAKIAAVLKEG